MKVHVCLVSAQAAPNLLAALDPQLKPAKVILVISQSMERQGKNLTAVLNEAGIKTEFLTLTDEHAFYGMQDELLRLASGLEQDDVCLNLTGGTKLMALAAQSIARLAGWRMFYVDVDIDKAIWLGQNGETPQAPQALTEQLRLAHYLHGYGFVLGNKPKAAEPTRAEQDLMDTLVREIGSLETPLSQLNWLTQQAEERRSLEVRMDAVQQDSRSLEALLRHFSEAKALTVSRDTIHFTSEGTRAFVKGGWLETHVFRTLNIVTGTLGIRDKAANLEVIDSNNVKNELDVAFMARNRLFVIECKTARMDKAEAPKANDTLFKLSENCRRIGGLGTRGMLVSYRPLRDAEKKLARALNIELVCGTDINRLQERLRAWVR